MTNILNKYKSDKDISGFTYYYDTPFHYVKEVGNRILTNCGLNYQDGAVLVDMSAGKTGWTREMIDTLHDFCVFAFTSKYDWEKEMADNCATDLIKFGIPVPTKEQIFLVLQHGKNCYAVEMNDNLVFT